MERTIQTEAGLGLTAVPSVRQPASWQRLSPHWAISEVKEVVTRSRT